MSTVTSHLLPPPPSSTPHICMYVCVCKYMYVYIYMFVFLIIYVEIYFICISSIVYVVCNIFVIPHAYYVCPCHVRMCMYVCIIVCSFNSSYFRVSSHYMQDKCIFLIYVNLYTCPHTPSLDVMWPQFYWQPPSVVGFWGDDTLVPSSGGS